MSIRFQNRNDAGRCLADVLRAYQGADPVVIALPGGGVPVACEVARILDAPLEVLVCRESPTHGRTELSTTGAPARLVARVAILVGDGLADIDSLFDAIRLVRSLSPRKVIVAVPVAPLRTVEAFRFVADDCVCIVAPEPITRVGSWYAA